MAIYGCCRVSTLRHANDGESLEVKRRQVEGYALMHRLKIDNMAIEEGVSGSVSVIERPAAGAIFAKLKSDLSFASLPHNRSATCAPRRAGEGLGSEYHEESEDDP
jgi:hypothetical protein